MKKAKPQRQATDSTPIAVAIATVVGAAALYCGEIIYGNIKDSGAPDMHQLPGWRAHMGAAFAGSLAFVTSLFLLESLGGRPKRVYHLRRKNYAIFWLSASRCELVQLSPLILLFRQLAPGSRTSVTV